METSTPQAWTKENLAKALNTAIAVELFTIPVYLSAASSIIEANRADKTISTTIHSTGTAEHQTLTNDQVEMFAPYDVIMSVAIQEMFHLTMACNLANSMGVRPEITAPDLNNPPSCLNGIAGMPVKGNLSTLIDTMLAIEAPDPKYSYDEDPAHPVSPNGPKLFQEEYDSIGDLYHALSYGVKALWNYDAANDAYQKTNFEAKYPEVNAVITTLNEAWNAIACIIEQGEGNGANGFMPEAYVPSEGQQYWELDEVSHWERFNDIKTFLKGGGVIPQYDGSSDNATDAVQAQAQAELTETYSKVINQMGTDFITPKVPLNLRGMSQTGSLSTAVWKSGKIPQWDYMADPIPWPPIPADAHVCQGLNSCKAQGYNNTGTKPGDGDCATSAQGCYTTNVCKSLGACGYVPTGVVPTPGTNDCSGQGGCQSPISPCQVYSSTTSTYAGQKVWDVARTLFQERLVTAGTLTKDEALPPITKVMDRRYSPAVNPTSGNQGNTCPLPSSEK